MKVESTNGNLLVIMAFFSIYMIQFSVKYFSYFTKQFGAMKMDCSTQTDVEDLDEDVKVSEEHEPCVEDCDRFSIIEDNPYKFRELFSKLK